MAALCTLQFSYSFPFLLKLTFDIQVDAMRNDKPFAINASRDGHSHRVDTWKQWSRWKRGLTTGNIAFKSFLAVLSAGSVSMALLGIGGCIVAINETFKKAAPTPFGCITP